MPRFIRWEQPHLHGAETGGEAKVASVDLFYDLIFAVVMAQLATALAEDITGDGLLAFVLLSVPAVRLWMGQTLYSDRFETIDVSYRLFVFASMLAASGLAVAAPSGLGTGFPLYAASFIASRTLLVAQWLRSGKHEPRARPLALRYVYFFSVEAVLWVSAVFSPGDRLPLLAVAVVADLLLPLTTTRIQGELGEFSAEHLSDRFVDFFLVVLGQHFIVAILIMTRQRQPTAADVTAGALSLMLAFVLWWAYVDHVLSRPLRRGDGWHAVWVYLHVPLFVTAAAFGSAFLTFVTRGEEVMPDPARMLLCGSFGLVLLLAGLAEGALVPVQEEEGRVLRASLIHGVPAALSALLGVLGRGLAAIPTLTLLLAIGLLAVLGGEYFRTPERVVPEPTQHLRRARLPGAPFVLRRSRARRRRRRR